MHAACTESAGVLTRSYPTLLRFAAPAEGDAREQPKPGSNSWAVSGIHTKSGVALIANDMHLDLGVPAVWYPARLRVTGDAPIDVTGVTLPGTPAVAAGSNGHVAWGFTNSYGDFADVRFGECASADYTVRREHIAVKGAGDAQVEYRDLAFGVVLDGPEYSDDVASGQCLQVGWMATRAEATNFALLSMERARNLDEVLALAPRIGIPAQNLVVGDAGGRIAWTVMGRMPRNTGPGRYFGALDFRDASDHPRIADPPVGRLWTANQRVVDGPLEAVLADDEVDVGADGYDIGARARQIRDDLLGSHAPRHRGGHAGDSARCARAVRGALARSPAGAHRRRGHARCATPPRVPRSGEPVEAGGGAGLGGLPAGTCVSQRQHWMSCGADSSRGC